MTTFHLTKGDLTRTVSVDAIVTLINSGGAWFGGIDGAIQRVAGGMYHAQAAEVRLRNKQVVIAKGSRRMHRGNFDDVIFVVDDLKSPLNELVSVALEAARNAGYQSVAFPMMRTGVMMGAVEPNVRAVVAQMRQAFEAFSADMDVYVVVYDDPEAVKLLAQNMNLLES